MSNGNCPRCDKPAASLFFNDGDFACRHCLSSIGDPGSGLIVRGSANPFDPQASTGHVKDIQDRRWHPQEKRMFYYSKEGLGKTYSFPKG